VKWKHHCYCYVAGYCIFAFTAVLLGLMQICFALPF
jgi:hypothetical protein